MTIIRAAGLPVSLWRNGAGRKSDVAAGPGWTVGFAWLDGDSAFSDYAGHDRTIMLAAGPGFTLDFAGRAPLVADQLFAPAPFDGGWAASCRVAGPCRVLNAMTERGRASHVMRAQTGPLRLSPEPSVTEIVVLLRGAGSVSDAGGTVALELLDAVLVDGAMAIEGELLAHITVQSL